MEVFEPFSTSEPITSQITQSTDVAESADIGDLEEPLRPQEATEIETAIEEGVDDIAPLRVKPKVCGSPPDSFFFCIYRGVYLCAYVYSYVLRFRLLSTFE